MGIPIPGKDGICNEMGPWSVPNHHMNHCWLLESVSATDVSILVSDLAVPILMSYSKNNHTKKSYTVCFTETYSTYPKILHISRVKVKPGQVSRLYRWSPLSSYNHWKTLPFKNLLFNYFVINFQLTSDCQASDQTILHHLKFWRIGLSWSV